MINEQAIIHPSAKLSKGVSVGPGTIIGADVEINEGTWIGPHAVIQGPTRIGKNNKIFQFASVGDEPQDVTYRGEPTCLEIGDNNIIREYCTISRGTVKGGGSTRVGNHNFLMAYTHIGHDCVVGDQVIMVNYSALAGHVMVDNYANIGAYAAVHQFCHIGAYAFISTKSAITQDVLPYVMIAGKTTAANGINTVGLRRRGFSSETIDCLRKAYKVIFRKGFTVQQAIVELTLLQKQCPEVLPLIEALNRAKRGIVR